MKILQTYFADGTKSTAWHSEGFSSPNAQLVLVFGERKLLESNDWFASIREEFPNATIAISSTSGEIYNAATMDNSVVVTALEFEKTTIKTARFGISSHQESYEAGRTLAQKLKGPELRLVFVLSDGNRVNGSDLTKGLNDELDPGISVAGGLAGDAARFEKTLVGLDEAPQEGEILAIGFYGTALRVGHGTKGGWDVFGPERQITRSSYNVLQEIDGIKALDLYKEYLGKYASDLPGAALLFPLSLKMHPDAEPVVRTILSIDEETGNMVFAGEVPEGAYIRMMKSNFDRLVDAAYTAAQNSLLQPENPPELAILVSCVGRKLVLGQRIDEEIEAAQSIFGPNTCLTGFYSYGEISPLATGKCDLHNQTMTITTFREETHGS